MTKINRVLELEELIKKHKALYYQGRPEISDIAYDNLEEELKALDLNNPILHIVGSLSSNLEKVKHDKKMLSLDKCYELADLSSWMGNEETISTFKVDGVSCSLIYKNGKLTLAKTRGDGSFGENITAKVLWMGSIPHGLKNNLDIEVRGEMFCTEEDFFALAEEMEKQNLERPSSQRNIVAGLIGRKENIELCRYIRFMAFDYIEEKNSFKTEVEKIQILKGHHFTIPDYHLHKDEASLKSIIEVAKNFMDEGPYQIDGLVFTFNKLSLHEELGETSHHPRYKMAYKFKGEAKPTMIEDITWQVSRNGILTPVANVEVVELSGAKISNVTLHNYGMVKSYHLKKGDKIEIIRSGEVIPKFLSVLESAPGEIQIPKVCPECSGEVQVRDIRLVCTNLECSGRVKGTILNFIEKIGIEDLSIKRLEELMRKGLVKKIPDLYRVTIDDFLSLEKTKETLAKKLFEAIEKSKRVDLVTFLSSLGLSGGAYNKCEKVVHAGFNTLEKIKSLTLVELMTVESFAEKSATEFLGSLKEKIDLINELVSLGFEIEEKEIKETIFSGKKICITGELSRKRSEIENLIRDIGGIVVGSVSKNTDFLLTNETSSNSSKFKKAQELKITVISEEEFVKKIS